nr:MAG TPA: hypothetical protein [Caudoviricetes sp.]
MCAPSGQTYALTGTHHLHGVYVAYRGKKMQLLLCR